MKKKYLIFVNLTMMVMMFLFSSCLSRDPKLVNVCDQNGIVRDLTLDGCKWSIEMSNGTRLIPVAADQMKYNWIDGAKVEFGYENQNEFNACMAGQTIRLTCLSQIEHKRCEGSVIQSYLMPEDSLKFAKLYNIIEYGVEKGILRLKIGFSGCEPDRDFSLRISDVASKSLPPQRNAALHFTNQACLAYFVKELCVDVTVLTEKTILVFDVGGKNMSITVEP